MISPENDKILSQLTVRLKKASNRSVIGSATIYYEKKLENKVYLLTASHCLFEDGDEFNKPFKSILVDLYNHDKMEYQEIAINEIDQKLIFKTQEKDVAVIAIEKTIIEKIVGELPEINIIYDRQKHTNFIVKGFPNATQGEELDCIFPVWKQQMSQVNKFQLTLKEDYSDWSIEGFSGGGVFLENENVLYLLGVFSRFRPNEKGKAIYCQYIYNINELLQKNYLPEFTVKYNSNYGFNNEYFENQVSKSIVNLGPRYDEELNFKLPISKLFNDITKDEDFKFRFFEILDRWLLEYIYDSFPDDSEFVYIDKDFEELKNKVKSWGSNIQMSLDTKIDIEWLLKELSDLNTKIEKLKTNLYDLKYEERKKNKDNEKSYDDKPYDKEIRRLRKIQSSNDELLSDLKDKVDIKLANNPSLIIDGDAGTGKSHLLGDISKNRIDKKFPTLLFLGQHFTNTLSIENNIVQLLNFKSSYDDLIYDLNEIGKQLNKRVLIQVDAINEGAGANLWRDQIRGFLKNIQKFPYIGIVLSIRTTYFKHIIPDEIGSDEFTSIKRHYGFKGNEYAALKMFCDFHTLKQPSFPILTPEFTNPLFLKIICEGVKQSASKEFPQGFHGVKKIFDLFINATENRLENKREKYRNRKLVKKVINKLALEIFDSEYRLLKIEDTFKVMDDEFAQFPELLSDLIEEGVFIKNLRNDYQTNKDYEVIYFAYERLGDFYIAEKLIGSFKSKQELKNAFKDGKDLGILLENNYYSHDGILEALAILLPEKYNLEMYEVYNWIFKKYQLADENTKFNLSNTIDWLTSFWLNSLNWRSIESIDNKKFERFFKSKNCRIDNGEWFLKLVELTAIHNHPFNSDRLTSILMRYTMAKRDSFWQPHLKWYSYHDDDNNGFPIRRLIDWAWTPNISQLIDFETSRLCGQTLVWILSSTNKVLRDQVTKALVNLLEQQPDALIEILKKFQNIDDQYISERLYAVAYGCILRTNSLNSIKTLALYTYNSIFSKNIIPAHILLRDYARNIVEFAIHKKVKLEINKELIRPPYGRKIPNLPTEKEVLKFHIKHDNPKYDKNYGGVYNQIHFSTISWDFGDKTVDAEINHFHSLNFNEENEIKKFRANLSKKQKKIISNFKTYFYLKTSMNNRDHRFRKPTDNKLKDLNDKLKIFYLEIIDALKKEFNSDEEEFIKLKLIPLLEIYSKKESNRHAWKRLDSVPFRRWIVKRVFELGYSIGLHGDYDRNYSDYQSHYSNDFERIGKKYQRIAFAEILGYIADNHKVECYKPNKEYDFYKGTWQLYSRDVDPVYITQNQDYDNFSENDFIGNKNLSKNWWKDKNYDYWDSESSNSKWVKLIEDIPKLENIILKIDYQKNEWLHLDHSIHYRKPKEFGEDKYEFYNKKRFYYYIQAYLVEKKEKKKIIKLLKNKDFSNWLPKKSEGYNNIFNREKFWAPSFKDENYDEGWENINDKDNNEITDLKVMIASTYSKGTFSEDKSGANYCYTIPNKKIFNGLKLGYDYNDGDLINNKNELIVTNINKKGMLINKKHLIDYLNRNDLDIIWSVSGEKLAEDDERHNYQFGKICGLYYFENGKMEGDLKIFDR